MKAQRMGCLFTLALVIFGSLAAAPTPTLTDPKAPALIPVSFTVTQRIFVADNGEHQPAISVKPSDATYSIAGIAKAKEPGTYTFTATATGKYAGSIECKWSIWPKTSKTSAVKRGTIREKAKP